MKGTEGRRVDGEEGRKRIETNEEKEKQEEKEDEMGMDRRRVRERV